MSDPVAEHPAKHDPLAALRQPSFLFYSSSRIFSTVGMTLLQAVMAWQVYRISGSPLSLGVLGLVRFLPSLALSLVGGATADAFNRRNIILIAQSVPLGCSIVLAVSTFGGWVSLELIFALVLLMGLSASFEAPARSALLPAIVRPETFANAVTVSSSMGSLGMVTGPAIGGAIIATAGVGAGYAAYSVLSAAAVISLALLRYEQKESSKSTLSLAAIREGVQFVSRRQVLLGAMTLDMFAVIFGGATALLPVYATDILHVGGLGYGLLTSSLEIGSLAMSVVMLVRPPVVNTGRVLIYTVIAYGLFTVLFGLSRSLPLSVLFYMLVGAADQVSMIMRNTTIQLSTPDELRGRVSAVSQVFIGASNQLGAVESGFLAAATSATFAVVSGGAGAMGVAAMLAWRLPELFHYRIASSRLITPAFPAAGEPEPVEEAAAAAGSS